MTSVLQFPLPFTMIATMVVAAREIGLSFLVMMSLSIIDHYTMRIDGIDRNIQQRLSYALNASL